MALNFSLNRTNCGDFKTFQILRILILRIILRKLQNSKKYSKNKTILRIRVLMNTGPVPQLFRKQYKLKLNILSLIRTPQLSKLIVYLPHW